MTDRKMRLGLSIRGHGYHPAAWRHPDVPADGTLQVEHYVRSAQIAERGKLDMVFFADGPAFARATIRVAPCPEPAGTCSN
jgi:alkanesulfonate monooxygenase SsuD/methylene tetrahydromethanopterin reductase-like flavin-dependent oxidoreductase (luciferase family)